jgi:hypothetical protein
MPELNPSRLAGNQVPWPSSAAGMPGTDGLRLTAAIDRYQELVGEATLHDLARPVGRSRRWAGRWLEELRRALHELAESPRQ